MPMTEDLAPFFDTAEFASSATWNGTTVSVIFDNAYLESLGMAERKPLITAAESDFAGVEEGDAVVIDGVDYTVASYEPDGTGAIQILLSRVS